MAKTLLAVDDSVTMRKVLEITFSGEDFHVVTADSTEDALAKMSESPQVCVVDTALGGDDGYALAKELRKRSPGTAIILLASRYAPYDQARGRDAGADDWADKPFDTQQLIDKVRKVALAKEATGVASAGAPPAAPPYRAPAAPPAPPVAAHHAGGGLSRGTQPSLSSSVPNRTGTLVFGEGVSSPPPAPVAARAPSVPTPAARPAPAAPVARAGQVGQTVNGHLASKLGELGLTSQQADAVLALSREVVERVVWEVVPQLAETIIKEEIARLTKD